MKRGQRMLRRQVSRRTLLKAGAGGLVGALVAGSPVGGALAVDPSTSDAQPQPDDFQALASGVAPFLVIVGNAGGNPFTGYLDEILRTEGIRDYEVRSLGEMNAGLLAGRRAVILGECSPSGGQLGDLQNYVNSGGGLVAMAPVAAMAGLLGVTTEAGQVSNGYFRITDGGTGGGLYGDTMQFHGSANRYLSAGATQVAQLYTSRNDGTNNVAASINTFGSGKAALFAFDIARSVVLMRQGNPANADRDLDGDGIVRTIDMYNGWIDLERAAVPQADMLQRLFVRVLEAVSVQPVPRLWYFPGTRRSVMIPTSDAHANPESYYQRLVNDFASRGIGLTFFMTTSGLPAGTVSAWRGQGMDFGTHPYVDGGYSSGISTATNDFQNDYGSSARTSRNHQVRWSGWDQGAAIQAQNGIEMDFNMYQWGTWLNRPGGMYHGYITGSGQPMRFVSSSGAVLPIYQQHTALVDEALAAEIGTAQLDTATAIAISRQTIDESVDLFHTAIATQYHVDYYAWGGVFDWVWGTTDYALQRGVQVLHAGAWLDFVKQRGATGFSGSIWSGGTLTFSLNAGGGGQTVLMPLQFRGSPLTSVRYNGAGIGYEIVSINGVDYAALPANSGTWQFSFQSDTSPPQISGVTAQNISSSSAQIVWTTDEPSSSVVSYGINGDLSQQASAPGLTTDHVVALSGLSPSTQYSYRVTSVDGNGNSASSAVATFPTAPASALALSAVSPVSGVNDVAHTITLSGTGFVNGLTVRLGGTDLGAAQFIGSSSAQATVPAGFSPGIYDVTVTNPDTTSATLPNAYTVIAQNAVLSSISPSIVSAGGQFSLSGSGFAGNATVLLGGTPIGATIQSSSSATAVVPAGAVPGVYDVSLVNPGQQPSTLGGALTVTGLLAVSHTTLADFSAGTFTQTQALSGGDAGDGALTLAPAGFTDPFDGTALNGANWATGLYDGAGSVVVSGGTCTIRGGWIRGQTPMTSGVVTARISFPNSAWQNFGLSRTDALDNPWLLFGVPGWDTSRVYARLNLGSTFADVPLTGLTGAPHDYTIEYAGTQVRFLVDGALVHEATVANGGALATWLSVGAVGAPMIAESVSITSYATSGSFLSAALDAGQSTHWAQLSAQASLPTGTSLRTRARSSTAGLTYSAWSAWSSTSPLDLSVPDGRYLQYELELSSSSTALSPQVDAVTATYQGVSNGVASVTVNPATVSLPPGGTQQFAATMLDAQGQPVAGATASWAVVNGGGTINTGGLFTAGSSGGSFPGTVVATSQGVTGAASVTVTPAAPAITGVAPASGTTAGGTTVTISGTNFRNGATVSFGSSAATNVTVAATSITATTPPGAAGTVDVTVTNSDGTSATRSAGFQYTAPVVAPTVTSVSPSSGTAAGGTSVNVNGSSFQSGATVLFGVNPATVTAQTSTRLTVTTPAGSAGAVDVIVTNPDGGTVTRTNGYTYLPAAPVVGAIAPNTGPTAGGTSVVISGANFDGATQVRFGSSHATSFVVNSATQITAVAPARSAGTVDVRVTTAAGQSATSTADRFTYVAAPRITSISPNNGPTAGGTTVTINGSRFTGTTQVRFGNVDATSFTVVSASRITAVAPAHASGRVDIRVTAIGGISSNVSADNYTYR